MKVGYRPKFCLIVIYIEYQSAVDSLQWNVESTSKLDSKGANTPMGPSGPHFKLMYHDDMVYKSQIGFRFILMHNGVLIIMQGCIGDNEQGFLDWAS